MITHTEVTREDGKVMWFIEETENHKYIIKQTFKKGKDEE